MRRRRSDPPKPNPLSLKGELEMADDPIDNFVIFDKGDDFHLCAALRAEERINLKLLYAYR